MIDEAGIAWTALLVLGAVHGINPGMGWLFAVSLGLQEERRGAVWSALGPLALGHVLAVAAALATAALLGRVIPLVHLRWAVAVLLVGLGVSHLVRHRHPRRGGMKVGPRDLVAWSFLVASAHGAGLMAVPFVLGADGPAAGAHPGHVAHLAGTGTAGGWTAALTGSAIHTGGYLAVTGLVALVVYEWAGLGLLRRAWINIDLLWAVALVATGLLTPLL